MKRFLSILLLTLPASNAFSEIRCLKGEAVRLLKQEETKTGCSIKSNDKIVYRAKNDKEYCKKKLEIHIHKLEKHGYKCVG